MVVLFVILKKVFLGKYDKKNKKKRKKAQKFA